MNYCWGSLPLRDETNMKQLQLSQGIRLIANDKPIFVLLVYWALTQLVVFGLSGVKTSVDTPLYLRSANDLLTHFKLEDAHAFWYVSYSMVLGVILNFTDSHYAMVLFQILLSGLALVALYKTVLGISSDRTVAFVAGFLYVFWFEIHTWNVFIYTESLFVSCSIITFYLLIHSKTYLQYLFTAVFILFTCLIRPVGFSLLAASLIYLFAKLELPTKSRIVIGFFGACLIFILLNKMLESYELVSSYVKAEIIYPDVNILIDKIPIDHLPSSNFPLLVFAEFVFQHPIYFFKLCAVKLALFFGHVKPYFSALHNGYIVISLYPLYFFAIWAYRLLEIDKAPRYFLLSFVGLQAATVMLTTENWDGRFLMPALPFVFILSAFGVNRFLQARISMR